MSIDWDVQHGQIEDSDMQSFLIEMFSMLRCLHVQLATTDLYGKARLTDP